MPLKQITSSTAHPGSRLKDGEWRFARTGGRVGRLFHKFKGLVHEFWAGEPLFVDGSNRMKPGTTLQAQHEKIYGFLILPKASNRGIKIDTSVPTFGWRDILGNVTQLNTGGSKPTFALYQGNLRQFKFAAGKEEYFEYHIPHDYVAGSDVHLHVHWSHISGDVTGGNIVFTYEISYSKSHNQAAFSAPVSTTFGGDPAGNASTTQYQQILTEVQISAASPDGNQIDSDDLEPDGLIMCRFEVTTNNITAGNGVPDPFIHYVDIHYQSNNLATKQKAPDFYV